MKITRSYSRKIQAKQYEPVEWFCSAEMDVPDDKAEQASKKLDAFVQTEVEESIFKYKNLDRAKIKDTARDAAEFDLGEE